MCTFKFLLHLERLCIHSYYNGFLLHYRKLGLPVKGLKKELISTLQLHMDNSSPGMSLHTKNTHFISVSHVWNVIRRDVDLFAF